LFKKNQIIHYEGDHATGIYLVMSGKVKTMGRRWPGIDDRNLPSRRF
jgi:hypothetical protein